MKKTNSMKKEFVVPLPMDESEFSKDGLLVEIRSQEVRIYYYYFCNEKKSLLVFLYLMNL